MPRTEPSSLLSVPVCSECHQPVVRMDTQPTYGQEFTPEQVVDRMVAKVDEMGWWELLHERVALHPEHRLRRVS